MAYTKKKYRSGQPRGGVKGQAVDSGFGSAVNKHKSKKVYKGNRNSATGS